MRLLTACPIVLTALTCVGVSVAAATDLQVRTGPVTRSAEGLQVTAEVAWENGWRTARNHDAVWLFVKLRARTGQGGWQHGRLVGTPQLGGTPDGSCRASADRVGAFCEPSGAHRGGVTWRVTLTVEPGRIPSAAIEAGDIEARVHGVEMVFIPSGGFHVGDTAAAAIQNAAFFQSDAAGRPAGLFAMQSEDPIPVGATTGALYYESRNQYQGDRQGPIPAEFPKGTRAFYLMKYELSQGLYADFLNGINAQATFFRAPMAGVGYAEGRGTIRLEGNRYVAGAPHRPANWVSWDDGLAFADWAGLRPYTELEYTKAARGPAVPVTGDYPWGTASKERIARRVGPDDDLLRTGVADEARLTEANRDVLGASFYWVMDLGGSVWEKVITVGHPRGRAFRGTHGDGVLVEYGRASNADWPQGDHEAGGYGYRGGGYYERGMVDRELNPFNPTEWRPFGSWGGAPRSIAYGFRAARTAEP